MQSFSSSLKSASNLFGVLLGCVSAAIPMSALTLPPQTTLPVVFTRAVDAKKAKSGDVVTAKTMQMVVLPDGSRIAKGTLLIGHVVAANAFHFDETPYAGQQPSTLVIHFDSLVDGGEKIPIDVSVRALANAVESWTAETPRRLDETDPVGTMYLIGGGEYSPLEKKVSNDDEDVIGYHKKQGVYARLLAGDYEGRQGSFSCGPTQPEQAVGIFSPEACGIYGFSTVSISRDSADGTFRLTSTHSTVKLYAGSTALLQVQSSR
jgi:hypothetical protein